MEINQTPGPEGKLRQFLATAVKKCIEAKNEETQRDILLELRGVANTLYITQPLIAQPELQQLDVTREELTALLDFYRANYAGLHEKVALTRVRNAALRMEVCDPYQGFQRFLQLLEDLQSDKKIKLVLL